MEATLQNFTQVHKCPYGKPTPISSLYGVNCMLWISKQGLCGTLADLKLNAVLGLLIAGLPHHSLHSRDFLGFMGLRVEPRPLPILVKDTTTDLCCQTFCYLPSFIWSRVLLKVL